VVFDNGIEVALVDAVALVVGTGRDLSLQRNINSKSRFTND